MKTDPMRALLVGKDWFPNIAGGLNRYFYGEVNALPKVGVCGTALVSSCQPGQNAPMTLRGMAAEGAGLRERWRGARQQVCAALDAGVDVVNAHFALYACSWMRDLPRDVPLVFLFHGPYADELAAERSGLKGRVQFQMARVLEKAVYRRASRVITLSEAFRDIAAARYTIPSERIRIVPGGVDLAPYAAAPDRREARTRLGWEQDRPILLTVRRLAKRMGLEMLIDAMQTVHRTHPNALLLIGGKGAIRPELESRIEKLGMQDCVKMLGFIADEELPLYYAAATAAIVPTVALEGFGLVTAEALASGTPVLGTPIGGTPEILHGLDPRLLFNAAESGAIAERIAEALSGSLELPDADTCRRYANRYGWETVAPRLRTIFEEARHDS